jgi:hypothetical protein
MSLVCVLSTTAVTSAPSLTGLRVCRKSSSLSVVSGSAYTYFSMRRIMFRWTVRYIHVSLGIVRQIKADFS